MKIKKNGKVINLTESDLKRIVKKILNEGNKDIYNLLSSGNATPAEIAEAMEGAVSGWNAKEAVMQSAVSAIKDISMYQQVSNILQPDKDFKDVVNWLVDEGFNKEKDFKTDFHDNKKETIYEALERLDVLGTAENNRVSLSSIFQDPMWVKTNQPGDTYIP